MASRLIGEHEADEAIAEILGTISLWSEVTRFNIGAQVRWPQESARRIAGPRAIRTGTDG